VYAIYLADETETQMPERIVINSFQRTATTKIYLLGYNKPLAFKRPDANGMEVIIPAKLRNDLPGKHAWVFKITDH
jgi:alpha-L-fucosidase